MRMDKQTNGQTDGQTNGHIFTQYSGISSHFLRGVWIQGIKHSNSIWLECNNVDSSHPQPDGGFVWETIVNGALCKQYTLQEPLPHDSGADVAEWLDRHLK